MQNMKTQLDRYAKTSGEPKGILVQQSGTPLSSLSLLNNNWQKEIDNINTQIDKWKDKLTTQVDRYTQQFTRLEMLINQMNSQSSTLAGLMGG
jgi:flagellar hook-associated protein 2